MDDHELPEGLRQAIAAGKVMLRGRQSISHAMDCVPNTLDDMLRSDAKLRRIVHKQSDRKMVVLIEDLAIWVRQLPSFASEARRRNRAAKVAS